MAEWPKTINVDKKIVPLLSEATYTDVYQVIREFVNNSYDADALRVDINIDIENKYIEIIDDGKGMTHEEFGKNFLTLALTSKIPGNRTRYGRPTVGKFGVGYLSATQFCKHLKVESTVEGSPTVFEAIINCKEFFTDTSKLVWQIPVPGRSYKLSSKIDESYTKIVLDGLTLPALSFFNKTRIKKRPKKTRVQERLKSSIKSWDGCDALNWKLQQILPIEYNPDSKLNYIKDLEYDSGKTMKVFLNNEQLFRNELQGDVLLKGHETIETIEGEEDIEFKYVILTPWKTIKPQEKVGIQTRLHNVGIGLPDLFGASFLTGHLFVTTRWVYGEIQIVKGLDKDLSIHRNGFNETDSYERFFYDIHDKMLKVLNITDTKRPSARKLGGLEREIDYQHELMIKMKNKINEEIEMPVSAILREDKDFCKSYVDRIYDKIGDEGIYDIEKVEYSGEIVQDPIKLDKDNRKLIIVENHPALKEHIFLEKKDFIVNYKKWEIPSGEIDKPLNKICEVNLDNNKIVLNQDFILFQDKKFSEIYKEFFSILSYISHQYPDNKDIYNYIAKLLIKNYLRKEGLV